MRWLGTQTVDTRFTDPLRALPICIRAGALGPNLPERDLFLSPSHGVLIESCRTCRSTTRRSVPRLAGRRRICRIRACAHRQVPRALRERLAARAAALLAVPDVA